MVRRICEFSRSSFRIRALISSLTGSRPPTGATVRIRAITPAVADRYILTPGMNFGRVSIVADHIGEGAEGGESEAEELTDLANGATKTTKQTEINGFSGKPIVF